jgi:hypothetical protein
VIGGNVTVRPISVVTTSASNAGNTFVPSVCRMKYRVFRNASHTPCTMFTIAVFRNNSVFTPFARANRVLFKIVGF